MDSGIAADDINSQLCIITQEVYMNNQLGPTGPLPTNINQLQFENLPAHLQERIKNLPGVIKHKNDLTPQQREQMVKFMSNNKEIQKEMDAVIQELKSQGVTYHTKENEVVGLGDVVEATLTKFGITQERFKQWFGLKECNCTERKKFLNNLFSWKKSKS